MIIATVLMALREIRRNLMRSGLTMLGVVIGVGAVVALVSIGRGATESVTSSIASMGHNMLTLSPGAARRGGVRTPSTPFKMEDVTALQQGGNRARLDRRRHGVVRCSQCTQQRLGQTEVRKRNFTH